MLQILINFYNQWNLVQDQLANLEKIITVPEQVRIILVDDCSRDNCWSEVSSTLNVSGYRILERKKDWNAGGARNLGFHVADNGLVLAYDTDHFPNKLLIDDLIEKSQHSQPNIMFRFKRNIPRQPCPYNIYAIEKETFWKSGAYDEDFKWYGDDKSFICRIEKLVPIQRLEAGEFKVVATCSERNMKLLPQTRTLLHEKLKGKVPWSTDYLRYKWETITLRRCFPDG
jgi:glycosyltransferase involved in cell wall biosynthesis